jgi:glycosyltransferase involved in cell wall biosynthesis
MHTKILFAVPRFSVGGAEKFLAHHLSVIDRTRYDVRLVTIFDEKKDSCADLVHIDECFHARSTWDIRAFVRLAAYVRRYRPDVVVTHLFTANLLVRFAAILLRVPVIVAYEHNIYPNKRRWQILVDRIFSWWTDRIVVDSDAAKIFTANQESIPLEKFTTIIIPPLLDTKKRRSREELRSDLKIPDGSTVITTVSRLVIDKGHTYLIDAAARVLKTHPDVYFVIGGWGPLQEPLTQQVHNLGISEHCRLLGKVDGQEFLALSDVYVDPSISTDLPIGIMEAMREGKAIVATDIGEIPKFVVHEETGLIVPPANPLALAGAIERMLDSSDVRARYGRAAKEKVEEYSLENYVKTFDSLIASLRAA